MEIHKTKQLFKIYSLQTSRFKLSISINNLSSFAIFIFYAKITLYTGISNHLATFDFADACSVRQIDRPLCLGVLFYWLPKKSGAEQSGVGVPRKNTKGKR